MELTTTRRGPATRGVKFGERPCADLYTSAPESEITLDEFELYALDRLRLLRGIETLKIKNIEGPDFRREVDALIKKYDLGFEEEASARRDHVSHYILRLAYCRTEELRRWFLQHECMLFKHRLDAASAGPTFAAFMAKEKLAFDTVSVAEARGLMRELEAVNEPGEADYYKIPFEQALSLVAHRTVFLRGGVAYVPRSKLTSIIITKFRVQLSRSLVAASNAFETVTPDQRIAPMLKNMNKQYTGRDFSKDSSVDSLTADQVDQAAKVHMPLCMKNLHDNLVKEGKTKHWGRLQYGLFLKGAGLSLEDALRFWETRFAKAVPHDQFQKQYAYSFRHMYGKEGARKTYTPYSCMKIIMGTPPEPGAHHGCPYRHASDVQLGNMLMNLSIDGKDATEIAKIARSGNYQIACQRHYDVTHPGHLSMGAGGGDSVANHPNQWYQSSVEYHKAKNGVKLEAAQEQTSSQQDGGEEMDVSTPQEA